MAITVNRLYSLTFSFHYMYSAICSLQQFQYLLTNMWLTCTHIITVIFCTFQQSSSKRMSTDLSTELWMWGKCWCSNSNSLKCYSSRRSKELYREISLPCVSGRQKVFYLCGWRRGVQNVFSLCGWRMGKEKRLFMWMVRVTSKRLFVCIVEGEGKTSLLRVDGGCKTSLLCVDGGLEMQKSFLCVNGGWV